MSISTLLYPEIEIDSNLIKIRVNKQEEVHKNMCLVDWQGNNDKMVDNMRHLSTKMNYRKATHRGKPLSIAILTGTLNPDLETFRLMLEAVKKQQYKGTIHHYILDGGTTNGGISLAKKYGCIVRKFPNDANEGSDRLVSCKTFVTEDIALILQSDNILPERDFLTQLIEPFEDREIFATFPMHNTYRKNMHMLTRYAALIGAPDPTLFYLGKSDKVPMFQKYYDKGIILREEKRYYKVKFTKDTFPTVGDNGFAVRTNIFKSLLHRHEVFYHTDKYMELLYKGIDTYGVTKNAIIHTTKPGILLQVRRRIEVKKHCTDEAKVKRVYLIYNPASPKDRWHLFLFIIYSITFIQPLALSIRGFISIPDVAWFLHPIMCILMVIGYGWSEISRKMKTFHLSL